MSTASSAVPQDKLAWGVIGTGNIAHKFANGVVASNTGALLAVASRSAASAARFGDEFAIPCRYDSYEALLADPDVQAVYISLPNHLHVEWSVRCAEAGKHVLCEKPMAINAAQAAVAIEAARQNDVFFMEAFMYRCHPQTAKLVELIKAGAVGDVRVIQAHFSYSMGGLHLENVRQQYAAAGGGIMDVGCYPISLARLVAGTALGLDFADPIEVKGVGHIGAETGVDEWATAVLRFPGDIVANVTCGLQVETERTLRVWGSAGHLEVSDPWLPQPAGNVIRLWANGAAQPEDIPVADALPIYGVEADAVARYIPARQAAAPCMSWADSLGNMAALDRWRAEVGLAFAGE